MCFSPVIINRTRFRTTNSVSMSTVDAVPCGTCRSCVVNKRNDLLPLIRTEQHYTALHGGRIAYVTFTYSEDNLPFVNFRVDPVPDSHDLVFGVDYVRGRSNAVDDRPRSGHRSRSIYIPYANYKDVQNFFKTVRKTLQRIDPNFDLRYIFASEYGLDERYTRRPHYHTLIFLNKSLSDYFNTHDFLAFIRKYWRFGFISAGKLGLWVPSVNGTPSYYISKYVVKNSRITDHPYYSKISRFVGNWSYPISEFLQLNGFNIDRCSSMTRALFSLFRLKNKIRKSIYFGHQQIPFIKSILLNPHSKDFMFSLSPLLQPLPASRSLIKYVLKHASRTELPIMYRKYMDITVNSIMDYLSSFIPRFSPDGIYNITNKDVLFYLFFYRKLVRRKLYDTYFLKPNLSYDKWLDLISSTIQYFEFPFRLSSFELSGSFFPCDIPFDDIMLSRFHLIDNALSQRADSKYSEIDVLFNHLNS